MAWGIFLFSLSFSVLCQDIFNDGSYRAGYHISSFPNVGRAFIEEGVRFWNEEIARSKQIPIQVSFYDDADRMQDDFEQGIINYIVASPLVIVQKFDKRDLGEGVKVIKKGDDHLLVMTRRDSHLTSLKELTNKKIGLLEGDLLSETYLDVLSLKYFSKPYKQQFKSIIKVPRSSHLVNSLFFGKLDAVLVYEKAYEAAAQLNPQIAEQLQIIAQTPAIPWGVGFFHRKVNTGFRDMLYQEVLRVSVTQRGQQLLNLFYSDHFEKSSLKDLDAARALITDYQNLLAKTRGAKPRK